MSTVTSADSAPADPDDVEARARLGRLAKDRRLELRISVRAAATRAHVARDTWTGLEEATRRTAETNYAGIEQTLRWTPGSVARVLAGGEPAEMPTKDAPQTAAQLSAPAARTEGTSDEALIRVMRSPDIDDATKAKIMRLLIAEQQRFERERLARVDELIQAFRGDE